MKNSTRANGTQKWIVSGQGRVQKHWAGQVDNRNKKWGGKGREWAGENEAQKQARSERNARYAREQGQLHRDSLQALNSF